jgi:hypothetical protein
VYPAWRVVCKIAVKNGLYSVAHWNKRERFVETNKPLRDIEKQYSNAEFVAKLRRLADCIERDEQFEIQVAGQRIYVPVRAIYNIEHERS